MRIHNYIYDFGISQDDPATELKALNLLEGDRLLCIASGGEMPLEVLINSDESVQIDAVDISEPQLFLSRLKLRAATELGGTDAARFLGYLPDNQQNRRNNFDRIKRTLPEKEIKFWQDNEIIFEKGPIHYGRYESYIRFFAPIGRWMLGGDQRIMGLFEFGNVEQQKIYFDEVLKTRLLKILFRLMFNKRIYKNRGISEQGLVNMGADNLALHFFNKFRGFCTNTLARENWYLQFMLFNRVLFEEALPGYLQYGGHWKLKAESHRLRLIKNTFGGQLAESPPGFYHKFAFSNISDWLTRDEMLALISLIAKNTNPGSAGLIRYIHSSGLAPENISMPIELEPDEGTALLQKDRFPFYNLIPFKKTGG